MIDLLFCEVFVGVRMRSCSLPVRYPGLSRQGPGSRGADRTWPRQGRSRRRCFRRSCRGGWRGARGDAAEILETADAALDDVAKLVALSVVRDRPLARQGAGDDDERPRLRQEAAEMVDVMAPGADWRASWCHRYVIQPKRPRHPIHPTVRQDDSPHTGHVDWVRALALTHRRTRHRRGRSPGTRPSPASNPGCAAIPAFRPAGAGGAGRAADSRD